MLIDGLHNTLPDSLRGTAGTHCSRDMFDFSAVAASHQQLMVITRSSPIQFKFAFLDERAQEDRLGRCGGKRESLDAASETHGMPLTGLGAFPHYGGAPAPSRPHVIYLGRRPGRSMFP